LSESWEGVEEENAENIMAGKPNRLDPEKDLGEPGKGVSGAAQNSGVLDPLARRRPDQTQGGRNHRGRLLGLKN